MLTTKTRQICSHCGSQNIFPDDEGKPYCGSCGRRQLTYADYGRIGGLQTVLRHPPGYMKQLGKRGGRPKTRVALAPEVKSKKGGNGLRCHLPNSIRELRELVKNKYGGLGSVAAPSPPGRS